MRPGSPTARFQVRSNRSATVPAKRRQLALSVGYQLSYTPHRPVPMEWCAATRYSARRQFRLSQFLS